MKKAFLPAILFVFLLAACTPVVEQHADGTMWVTSEKLMEYKYVQTGSFKVGKVIVPIYGYRWREVDSVDKTGTDKNPVAPNKVDCGKVQPESPEKGSKYCEVQPTRYYLLFGDGKWKVEVSKEVWQSHTPDKLHQTQETPFGLFLVQK